MLSFFMIRSHFISLKSHDHHREMCLDNEMVEWGSKNLLFLSHFLLLYYIFFSSQEKSVSK